MSEILDKETVAQLTELSLEELDAIAENAKRIIAEKKLSLRASAIAQIKAIAASIDLPIVIPSEKKNGGSKYKGTKVSPKYRNAFGKEWSGRGMKPKWLQDAIADGASLESFLIGEDEL
jgi:DNA-binding protein H-NS